MEFIPVENHETLVGKVGLDKFPDRILAASTAENIEELSIDLEKHMEQVSQMKECLDGAKGLLKTAVSNHTREVEAKKKEQDGSPL